MPKNYEYLGLMPEKNLKDALKFVNNYANGIATKWAEFFVMNKRVSCEVISQKL